LRYLPTSPITQFANVPYHTTSPITYQSPITFLFESDRAGRSLFALANREINRRLGELYRDLPPLAMGRFGEKSSCEEEIV
jgi:hypothetical protein